MRCPPFRPSCRNPGLRARRCQLRPCFNTFIANLKFAVRGTYHQFDFDKYRVRHLAEAQYWVNRRFQLRSLADRLRWTCARTEPCSEVWLRLGVVRAG